MRKILLDVPEAKDEPLFEYISFKKQHQSAEPYTYKAFKKFHAYISTSTPKSEAPAKKQVVIKNIGNMKRAHLSNALSYCLKNSALSALLQDSSFIDSGLESSAHVGLAFNHLSELVGYEQIVDDWSKDFSKSPSTNEALHVVFSLNEMPSQSAIAILQNAVRESMQANMPEHKWIMIPHAHQNRPHIHVIINKTNIFSKKKLHFGSKSEIAEFFHVLREDFVQQLYTYSQGRLDYTNEIISKEFRANLLSTREAEIENATKDPSDSKALIDDMVYISMQQRAITSLNLKRKPLYLLTQSLEKELKNTRIYLHNVEKKIANLQAQGQTQQQVQQIEKTETQERGSSSDKPNTQKASFAPTKLLAKRDELTRKIASLQQQITNNKTSIQELDSGIKQLFDSSESFASVTKHFSALHKKKALLSSCKGFERYLSKDLVAKLSIIKQEVAYAQAALKYHFNDISASILQAPKQAPKTSSRRTIFAISKQLRTLARFKGMLDVMGEQELESSQKKRALDEIECMELELKSQIQERFMRLLDSGLESKQHLDEFAKAVSVDDVGMSGNKTSRLDHAWLDNVELHLKLHKKHAYIQKELAFALKVCAKHGIELDSTHNPTLNPISHDLAHNATKESTLSSSVDSGIDSTLESISLQKHTTQTLNALESSEPESKNLSSPESTKHPRTTQSPIILSQKAKS